MTPVTQAATAMASSQVDKRKEVTISTDTPSESSFAATQRYEWSFFCSGTMHNMTKCPVRGENCHKSGTKGHM